jgi:hypothetical protein
MDGEHSGDNGYILRDQNDHVQEDGQNQQDEEQFVIIELLNVTNISCVLKIEHGESSNPNGLEQHYYVERPHVLVEEDVVLKNLPM